MFVMRSLILVFLLGAAGFSTLLSAKEYKADLTKSHVGFNINHLVLSRVDGEFKDFEATLDFNEQKKEIVALQGSIKVTSIDTKNKNRDDHLRTGEILDVAKFPSAQFVMKRYTRLSETEGEIQGEMTMKGATKPVTLKAKIAQSPDGIALELSGSIDRRDFNVTYNRVAEGGGLTLGDEVKIDIKFHFLPQ